jgi:hypothetical protein
MDHRLILYSSDYFRFFIVLCQGMEQKFLVIQILGQVPPGPVYCEYFLYITLLSGLVSNHFLEAIQKVSI